MYPHSSTNLWRNLASIIKTKKFLQRNSQNIGAYEYLHYIPLLKVPFSHITRPGALMGVVSIYGFKNLCTEVKTSNFT